MSSILNALVLAVLTIMDTIAAKTATFNGTAVDMLDYEGMAAVIVSVGAVSGTTMTLDGKLQSSDTSGGTYADISGATHAQIIASGVAKINFSATEAKRWVRYVGTIAGTSPSFTMGTQVLGIKKNT